MDYSFDWDEQKNQKNQSKHGISFELAQEAFFDRKRLIIKDTRHSTPDEKRFYCVGRIEDGVVTVRFTYRGSTIRIFGAGYWRNYRKLYLMKNSEK